MAQTTIGWTSTPCPNSGGLLPGYTFNPWFGCQKVHEGCATCYAEAFDKRLGGDHWGPGSSRRMIFGQWNALAKWNAIAKARRVPASVFSASMADIFEDQPLDKPVVNQLDRPVEMPQMFWNRYEHLGSRADGKRLWSVPALRLRLLDLVSELPWLKFLLLTKRPQNILSMVPREWLVRWPENVMTGTSISLASHFAQYHLALMGVPGSHFLSIEPILGEIDAERVPLGWNPDDRDESHGESCFYDAFDTLTGTSANAPSRMLWVIAGCESKGRFAGRFADGAVPAMVKLAMQCRENQIAFFPKQIPIDGQISTKPDDRWPEILRHQQFPNWISKCPTT